MTQLSSNRPADAMPRCRASLLELPTYGTGRPGWDLHPKRRLSSNESPFAPSPAVIEAVTAALGDANRYPPLVGESLIETLAARHDVPFDEIAVGSGSLALLEQLVRAFAGPGDEVLMPWRSYEAYPIIVGGAGAEAVTVPLDAHCGVDAEALAARVGKRTRVVLLCNPNNPTGTALRAEAIDAFVRAVPGDVLVVLDEAYREFVTDRDVPDGIVRYRDFANVAVLRTFSKAYSLAGLRVGYCVAKPTIIDALRRVAPPFPVSAPALAAARAACGQARSVERDVGELVGERERMRAALLERGLPVAHTQANFVWLPVGENAQSLAQAMLAAGIGVRCFPGEGVRITAGRASDTDAVVACAARWIETRRAPA